MSRPSKGDRVQRHAFSGAPYRSGFRGVVTGANGRTVRVLDDDGTEWDADPTELVADGTPWKGACRCSCCGHPPAPWASLQMELF